MAPEVEVVNVEPTVFASVREKVPWANLPRRLPEMLGEIWEFLKTAPVKASGHNVAVYRNPRPDGVEVEAGVQVSGEFSGSGRIRCSSTPAGEAAHAIHIGRYRELGRAHDALVKYCECHRFPPGIHWEVYGDWNEDESQLRTDVYRKTGD